MLRRAQVVASLVELVGMVAVVVGVAMFSVPVAFIVGGVGLVTVGYSIGVGVEKR